MAAALLWRSSPRLCVSVMEVTWHPHFEAFARAWPCGGRRGGWGSTPGKTWRSDCLRDNLGVTPHPLWLLCRHTDPSQRFAGLPERGRCFPRTKVTGCTGRTAPRTPHSPHLTSLAPDFPPAAQSSPLSAALHQSQRRFRRAPPRRGATAIRQEGLSSARAPSQKSDAGLRRCPPFFQMV